MSQGEAKSKGAPCRCRPPAGCANLPEVKRISGFPACFGCGRDNPWGLRLELFRRRGKVTAACRLDRRFAGFPGTAHGGILAALLDEVMAWAAMEASGRRCVTGELLVRYLRPVPLGEDIRAWGEAVEQGKRSLRCRGQIEEASGEVLVRGEGEFFPEAPGSSPPA